MFWMKKPGWFGKQLDVNIERVLQGDHRYISLIFCVFAEDHAISKEKAARVLLSLLDEMQFDDIVRTDMRMRETTSMEWSINWREKKLGDFFTRNMTDDERRAVTVFASFNPNGYIREQAVRQMIEMNGTMPYIILRQNDWVQQVRYAASRAFDERIRHLATGELVAALPFSEKLKWSSRGSHDEYTEKFFLLLCSPAHQRDLEAGLNASHVRTRRICIRAMLSMPEPDLERIKQHLLRERDPFLRAILFRGIAERNAATAQLAEYVLKDKFPLNRILALQYFDKAGQGRDVAFKLLPDRNTAVRDEARRILLEHEPQFDCLTYYCDRLAEYPETTIYGIGEVGSQGDAASLEGYLSHEHAGVVRATMTSLMRLDSDQYAPGILEKLASDQMGIVKTAQRLLFKHGVPDYKRLWELFTSVRSEQAKLKCLSLLETDSKWSRLIYLLRTLPLNGELLQRQVLSSLQRWTAQYNRSFIQASNAQKEAILELLDENAGRISPGLLQQLRFLSR